MTRRNWLRGSAFAAAAAAGLGARRILAQQPDSTPPPGAADRLYDPSVVQERAAATAADNDPVIKAIEHRLKCTCGCNLDIYTCRTTDFTCSYSPNLHREVMALRSAGKTPDEIVVAFTLKYGESVLMAPKPEGFNLAGYLVPGILMALAALLLAVVLVRRGRRPAPAPAVPGSGRSAPSQAAPNPADQERLRRALAEVQD
ncbi:MAG TPA: cytochrome c-type biogenesis protein CcmH [Gemmatimonadales bacterium]|nr:cytochrome c-type biogenesis protein CcmH [Gemmatimonadales bacterium]